MSEGLQNDFKTATIKKEWFCQAVQRSKHWDLKDTDITDIKNNLGKNHQQSSGVLKDHMKGKNGRGEKDNQHRQLHGQVLLQHGAEQNSTELEGEMNQQDKNFKMAQLVCMATGRSQ